MDGSAFNRTYAVVLRFAGLHPSNLSRLEMHARRSGGDLEHCDPIKMQKQKTVLNGFSSTSLSQEREQKNLIIPAALIPC